MGAIYTTTSFFLAQVAIVLHLLTRPRLLLGSRRTHGAEIGPFSRGNWVALHLTLTTTVVETRIAEVLASQQRCFYYCCLAPRPRHVIATLCVAAARIWKIQWSYSRKLQLFWSSSSQKDWEVWNRRREEKNDVVFFWIPPHLGYFPCHPVSWLALIFATTTLSSKFQSTIYLL